MPIEVVSCDDTIKWKLKRHMGSNQPTNQPGNKSTIQTNCKQTLRNQPDNMPANQLTIEHLQAKQPEVEPTLYTNLPNDK